MTNFIYHSYAMNASCMSENIFAKLKHFYLYTIHHIVLDFVMPLLLVKSRYL